jgi:hypothetical protein
MRTGDTITPRLVASRLVAATSSAPPPARLVYVLNKVDAEDRKGAAEAAKAALQYCFVSCENQIGSGLLRCSASS